MIPQMDLLKIQKWIVAALKLFDICKLCWDYPTVEPWMDSLSSQWHRDARALRILVMFITATQLVLISFVIVEKKCLTAFYTVLKCLYLIPSWRKYWPMAIFSYLHGIFCVYYCFQVWKKEKEENQGLFDFFCGAFVRLFLPNTSNEMAPSTNPAPTVDCVTTPPLSVGFSTVAFQAASERSAPYEPKILLQTPNSNDIPPGQYFPPPQLPPPPPPGLLEHSSPELYPTHSIP